MTALANLAREISTGTGTGNLTLARDGGHRRISEAFGTSDNGDDNPYIFIVNTEAASEEWEIRKTYTSDANTLVRSGAPYKSSNSGSTVNFSAGTKTVTNFIPAAFLAQLVNDRELFDGVSFMALARALGVAQFAGDRFADSFGALTYVDTAGATNLDTGTSGVLKATGTGGDISAGTGSNIGNLTSGGGLSAVFDGATNQAATNCGQKGATTNAYAGKDYSSSPKKISKATVYGANNDGFTNKSGPTVTLTLYGKNSSAPSNGTDGTPFGSINFTDTGDESGGREITSTDESTAWDYVWVYFSHDGSTGTIFGAEIVFTEVTVPDNVTVASEGVTPVNTPAEMILCARVKHVDSATAGTDYNFQASRNDGSDYSSNLTLHDRFTDPSDACHVIESDPIDLSGQTSPSDVKWKWTTANNKAVELRDVYWRAAA